MADENLTLYVATYDDADSASDDFEALKAAREDGLVLIGAVVMTRPDDNDVKVKEVHGGEVADGATVGAIGGLVVGLFAPPLLLATVVGAGVGAGVGELVKRHEEKELGVDADEYLPPGSSAVVAVVDDAYLDGVDRALGKADKKVSRAIDSGDYDKVKKAVQKSEAKITSAIEG